MGLTAMHECSKIDEDGLFIPRVFHYGDFESEGGSVLIMEYMSLGGRGDEYALGRAVGKMHRAPPTAAAGNPDSKFGFPMDNTIGGTSQPNGFTAGSSTEDWVAFYSERRIGHQLQLAGDGYCSNLWNVDIAPRLNALFDGIDVQPSILHGDLWSGNIGSVENQPTIYDPATYWGHHEAEWGMSWCAGFGPRFWEGYRTVIPQDEGFVERKALYDAYHQLNHYNLFGGGYLSSARVDLERVKKALDARKA